MSIQTVVSAPGKVLLTGGYLILDNAYRGVVVTTNVRFYTRVETLDGDAWTVEVRSPQFQEIRRLQAYLEGKHVHVLKTPQTSSNHYVDWTLQHALTVIAHLVPESCFSTFLTVLRDGLCITIQGDDDFYSSRNQDLKKTGLGSSAALITSLVAALLVHFHIIEETAVNQHVNLSRNLFTQHPLHVPTASSSCPSFDALVLIHNLAQFCHALAQGKVGSGFDISSAVYGSQWYRRFSASILDPWMELCDHESGMWKKECFSIHSFIHQLLLTPWDAQIHPFTLPANVHLTLYDRHASTSSPHMVQCLLKWCNQHKEQAKDMFHTLNRWNEQWLEGMHELQKAHTLQQKAYHDVCSVISHSISFEWKEILLDWKTRLLACPQNSTSTGMDVNEEHVCILELFLSIQHSFHHIREGFQQLSHATQLSMESEESTRLLHHAMYHSLGGWIAGIPGAGGNDAVFVLRVGNKSRNRNGPVQKVKNLHDAVEKEPIESCTWTHLPFSEIAQCDLCKRNEWRHALCILNECSEKVRKNFSDPFSPMNVPFKEELSPLNAYECSIGVRVERTGEYTPRK